MGTSSRTVALSCLSFYGTLVMRLWGGLAYASSLDQSLSSDRASVPTAFGSCLKLRYLSHLWLSREAKRSSEGTPQ